VAWLAVGWQPACGRNVRRGCAGRRRAVLYRAVLCRAVLRRTRRSTACANTCTPPRRTWRCGGATARQELRGGGHWRESLSAAQASQSAGVLQARRRGAARLLAHEPQLRFFQNLSAAVGVADPDREGPAAHLGRWGRPPWLRGTAQDGQTSSRVHEPGTATCVSNPAFGIDSSHCSLAPPRRAWASWPRRAAPRCAACWPPTACTTAPWDTARCGEERQGKGEGRGTRCQVGRRAVSSSPTAGTAPRPPPSLLHSRY
jgi:hypothetical protein